MLSLFLKKSRLFTVGTAFVLISFSALSSESPQRKNFPAIVKINSSHVEATAFFISPDTLVTNFHVISNLKDSVNKEIFFETPAKKVIPVEEITALDVVNDLAVLKVKNYQSKHYYSIDHSNPSQEIQTAGFSDGEFKHTLGWINSQHQMMESHNRHSILKESMGPGSSGSPVFFKDKSLAGIHTSFIGETSLFFAPVEKIKELLSLPLLHCRLRVCIEKEIEHIYLQAENGNKMAQYRLGMMLHHGNEVDKNEKQAFRWLKKAAKSGLIEAQYDLGMILHYHDEGRDPDYKKALQWIEKAAKNGMAQAQHNSGIMYLLGQGVKQNSKKALKQFEKAAKNGLAQAQHNSGIMYLLGQGVEQNSKKALQWFEKSAKNGLVETQHLLEIIYEGQGRDQNIKKDLQWIGKAGQQDDVKLEVTLESKKTGIANKCLQFFKSR